MDIDNLIERITKATYDDSKVCIFSPEHQKMIKLEILNWYNESRCEEMQLEKEKAALEAKCYVYEQIISNSNFAPIAESAKVGFCTDTDDSTKKKEGRRDNMLTFHMKKEWYEKIKSGEKTVEYREIKPYWTKRFERAEFSGGGMHWDFDRKLYVFDNFSAPCFFRLGYTKKTLEAWITKIDIVDGKDTDLHIDKPVYAIHFYLKNNIQLGGNL